MLFRGQEISWNVSFYEKSAYSGEFDIFEQLNAFWATLPEDKQVAIFNTYSQIRDVFNRVWTMYDLTKEIQPLIKQLYEIHDLNALRSYVDFRANIIRPRNLMESFDEGSHEMPGTRERTYLVDDYQWLITMTIALRAMHPIWGEFIFRTKEESGTDFKEMWAAVLLNQSKLNDCIPMEKLRVYIQQSIPTEKSKASILSGVSSEDFDTWMCGLVLVRRLAIADIRGLDQNSNVITFIYRYIDHKVNSRESGAPGGRVNDKNPDSSNIDSESNLSMLENYKVRQALAAGDIAMIDNYASNYQNVAKRICPDIDLNLVEEFIDAGKEIYDYGIAEVQVNMAQVVLAEEIPPYGQYHFGKPSIITAMATAQAILWHCGYKELAALMSAVPLPNEEGYSVNFTGSRSRIPKEMVAKLDELFPFSKRGSGRRSASRTPNAGQVNVEAFHDNFTEVDWRLTIPGKRIEEITGNRSNKRFSAPSDLRVQLAELFIAIAESEEAFHKPRGSQQ